VTAPRGRIPALDELRERLREAAHRELTGAPRRRRRRRRAGGLLAAVLLVAAGAAGAADLIATGEPVKDPRAGMSAGYRPGPGLLQLSVIARDPAGGPGWGVRVYTARNHQRCVLAGVVNGADLGRMSGGRFHPYQRGFAGACGRPGRPFGTLQYTGGRTLVFGIARPGAQRVTIAVSGAAHSARTGRGGAFLAVYRGEVASDALQISYD
jgi:hypothetical protein